MNSRLCIIVLVHERKCYINQLLKFYEGQDFELKIYDSSKTSTPIPKKYALNYFHLPGENYYKKMQFALANTGCDYVLDLPDDDFVPTPAILNALNIFDSNKNIVSVFGQVLRFSRIKKEIYLEPKRSFQYEKNSKFENVKYFFSNFFAITHAITKRSVAQEIYNLISDNTDLYPIKFLDKIYALLVHLNGELVVLPSIYQVRNIDDRMIHDSENFPEYLQKDVEFDMIFKILKDENHPLSIKILQNVNEYHLLQKIIQAMSSLRPFNHSTNSDLESQKLHLSQIIIGKAEIEKIRTVTKSDNLFAKIKKTFKSIV